MKRAPIPATTGTPRRYVLVTPAKNEAHTIGITIDCVVKQTVRPREWLIVSDGSTDQTDAIVRAASSNHPWIRLLSLPSGEARNFASVVRATETGVRAITAVGYEYLGLLDSDVRFARDYFEKLLGCFESCPRLGLAGGAVIDWGLSTGRLPTNRQDVPGAVQFFRRSCFEALGGLLAIPEGGWDALTCAKARMLGYETRLVTDLIVDHLKPRNSSEGGLVRRFWQLGVRDYALGYHPLFAFLKSIARLTEPPVAIGGIARWIGFCHAMAQRHPRAIPADLLQFMRREQKNRTLGKLFSHFPAAFQRHLPV